MDHLASYYIEKEPDKEKAKARQAARKRVEVYWSRAIEHIIDRNLAATPTTIAASLGVNPQPTTPHERTALRQLYRRCDRGAAHGRYRALYEYTTQVHGDDVPKDRQRQHAGKVWYVSLHANRKEGFQYKHKALIADVRETLEKLPDFETVKTDTEMRDAKAPLIYDLYGKLGGESLAIECNRSDWPKEMSKKCRDWKRIMDNDRYEFPFRAKRYLWVMETEDRAWNLRDRWIEDGLVSGEFLVTWASQFSAHRPASILDPIWLWPKDDQLQSLRRD
jgi:hypothetical protein